jgi:hypothetical protein
LKVSKVSMYPVDMGGADWPAGLCGAVLASSFVVRCAVCATVNPGDDEDDDDDPKRGNIEPDDDDDVAEDEEDDDDEEPLWAASAQGSGVTVTARAVPIWCTAPTALSPVD